MNPRYIEKLFTLVNFLSIAKYSSASEEHHHKEDEVYCAKECITADPCGAGKGLTKSCLTVIFDDVTTFGYDQGSNSTKSFLGCQHDVCETACAGADGTKKMDIANGTFCFPHMELNGDMFATKDLAELAAVSRGCSGSHAMNNMFMVGTSHGSCPDDDDHNHTSSSNMIRVSTLVVAFTSFLLAPSNNLFI